MGISINEILYVAFCLVLYIYSFYAKINLPDNALLVFEYDVFKILFLSLCLYHIYEHDYKDAIIITIIFFISVKLLHIVL